MTERQIQYATQVSLCIGQLFDRESDHFMGVDLGNNEEIKDLLYVLSSVVPCEITCRITGNEMNSLEFNHLANKLCFENMIINPEE